MFKYLFFVTIALFFFAIQSCKTVAPMTTDHPDRIEYGSFGGFAGSYIEYKVLPDGQLWKKDRLKGGNIQMEVLDQDVIAQLTSVIKGQKKAGYVLNNPGNMTYFIRLCEEGEPNYELIWGGGEKVDPRIKAIYKTLVKMSKEYHPSR